MRKALSAIRHWPKPPAAKSMNDFFTFQIQTLSSFAFFPPQKKHYFAFKCYWLGWKVSWDTSGQNQWVDTFLQSESSRKQSRSLHSARHISQQPELLLIKICALAAHAAVREVGKANGNPIHSGWVKKAAEEYHFPPKIWLVQTALALTITMVSPSQSELTNDRSTP